MYKIHGFQDKDQLLETLVKENSMTFFPEFNLLAVTSSPALFRGPMSRETAIFNVTASEISSGEFFKGCDYVSDFVFKDGRDKAFAIIDSYEQDSDGFTFHDRRIDMLSRLFSWSSTITAGSIPDMVRRASYYQKHLMSNRESFELSHGKPLSEISERPVGADAKELLDKLTSSETVSYFPEFNLLVTTTEYDPLGLHDRDTCVFNVFPSELAYEKLFHGFENVADIPYSGPVVDPIAFQPTFIDSAERDRSNDVDLGSLAMLLPGSDVISTQSVPELLETMADRFGIEPEERALNADRARAEECIRAGVPNIQVEIDSTNDDNFIEGTVTVEGESCYFYRPNSTRSTEDYDSVVFEPFRPDGFEGDIEEIELPAAIDQNRELAELVVSVATEPYMDPDKADMREQSIDSLCEEKTEVSESMRYGMEGVGLPMLDAAEHLANYWVSAGLIKGRTRFAGTPLYCFRRKIFKTGFLSSTSVPSSRRPFLGSHTLNQYECKNDGSHHGLGHQPARPEYQHARQSHRRRPCGDGLQYRRRTVLPPRDGARCIERQ